MPQIIGKENEKISLRHYSFKRMEALCHTLPKGSLTLEAALSLPVFLFAVGMVLYLFLMLQIQYTVGNSLDQAVAENVLLRNASESKVKNLTKAAFYQKLVSQGCPLSPIELGMAGFSWKNTKVDGSHIVAQVTYTLKMPFGYFGKRKVKLSNRCKMRRWTGKQGANGIGKKQQWVYITPTDTVYHETRSCTHLMLSVKQVPTASLKGLKQYGACGHCTKGKKKGSVAYVTDEGDCYHYTIHCSGLKRTVYMIRKEEAGGKPACSRCGGK